MSGVEFRDIRAHCAKKMILDAEITTDGNAIILTLKIWNIFGK